VLPVCPRRPDLPSQPHLTGVGAVPDRSLAGARASQRRCPRRLRHPRYTQPLRLCSPLSASKRHLIVNIRPGGRAKPCPNPFSDGIRQVAEMNPDVASWSTRKILTPDLMKFFREFPFVQDVVGIQGLSVPE